MVTTPSAELARAVRVLRNQGMEKRYENEVVGFNTRMTDIHAAIGRVQLTKLAGWTAKRQANAAFLSRAPRGRRHAARRPGRRARVPPVHDPRRRPRPRRVRRAADREGRRQRRLLPDADPPAAVVQARPRPARRPSGDDAGAVAPGLPGSDRRRARDDRRGRQRRSRRRGAERAARRRHRPGRHGPPPHPRAQRASTASTSRASTTRRRRRPT